MRLGLLFIMIFPTTTAAAAKAGFDGAAMYRFAERVNDPAIPASERYLLSGEQKLAIEPRAPSAGIWNFVVGGHGWYENVYFSRGDDATREQRVHDSHEVRLQNAYVDYKNGGWSTRIGNQQIVWGEAFGNAFADIVNPKDLRDGLPLDSASVRRAIPIGSLKYVGSDCSLQALVSPFPEFNLLPLPGSDFALLSPLKYGFKEIQVEREERSANPMPEPGARLSATLGATDLSLLFFEYYDRDPVYTLQAGTAPGQTLFLRERHERIRSQGLTVASDLNGYIVRTEIVHHDMRAVPTLENGAFGWVQTDELDAVASLDFPTWRSSNFSLQVAGRFLSQDRPYLLRRKEQTLASARALFSVFKSSTLELLASDSLSDAGQRLQCEWMTPIASNLELRLGGEIYGGPAESEFGRFRQASRAFASLKLFLSGISSTTRARQR